jgi:YHS domain-containing protein
MKKIFALFVLLVTSILHSQETDTLKVDAVELVKGKEILGKENYAVTRDNYTYLFSNNKNKSIFKQHPADYEIQLGGACGRMGPLSGKGKTDLYFVYKDKIYIFASPACKATFEKFPDKLLEFDDAKPLLTAEALEEGAILLNKVIDAIGGAEKIDAVISYQEVSQKEIEHQGKNVAVAKTRAFVFPDKLREDEVFSNWTWGNVVNKEDAYHYYNETKRSMVQDQASAMQRLFNRNLIYIPKILK